jgi:hypothetical protein
VIVDCLERQSCQRFAVDFLQDSLCVAHYLPDWLQGDAYTWTSSHKLKVIRTGSKVAEIANIRSRNIRVTTSAVFLAPGQTVQVLINEWLFNGKEEVSVLLEVLLSLSSHCLDHFSNVWIYLISLSPFCLCAMLCLNALGPNPCVPLDLVIRFL